MESRRPAAGFAATLLVAVAFGSGATPVPAQERQPPTARSPRASTRPFVTNLTRVEAWRYFEPRPEGGDPTYAFVANRLRFGLRHEGPRLEVLAAGQYVQLGGLPTNASGPGPYGTGALYFGHSRNASSRQAYLRYLSLGVKELVPGLRLEVGRMGHASGSESPSGHARLEALKSLRVASRLLGEFEWSIYERGYDGLRVEYSRPRWHATAVAYHPTQGGFEEAAGVQISDIDVLAGSLTIKPSAVANTETQVFFLRYNDRREVTQRVDNTGLPGSRVDVKVNAFGATVAGAYPAAAGIADALVWVVGQTGSWYGQTHRAFAIAVEGGYQWNEVPWRPWVRLGAFRGSGDEDPTDNRHGTFFQMLPTVRKYSLTASYNLMNSTDLFVQAILRPLPAVGLRIDLHRIGLTEAADRWYFGSGATQQRGSLFGYGARPSNGSTSLGTVIEGAASYTINPHWSVNGYLGLINGGEVVLGSFDDRRLTFGYLENVVRF